MKLISIVSTYLVAIGEKILVDKLNHAIRDLPGSVKEELRLEKLSNACSALFVGKTAEKMKSTESGGDFFSGWMLDHHDSSITLGQCGFNQIERKGNYTDYTTNEGSFIHVNWGPKFFKIQHDCFGLYPILYFYSDGLFVASDSILTLASIRTIMGMKNKMNQTVHSTRSWTNGLACSIMSTQTIIKEIQYLPPASSISVIPRLKTHKLSLKVSINVPNYQDFFKKNERPYIEELQACVAEIVGSISAIQSLNETELMLGLSGGLDSRILFGIVKKSWPNLKQIDIRSNTHSSRRDDYKIANQISNIFKFDLNKGDNTKNIAERSGAKVLRIENMFSNWALSNLGLFDMTYMYRSYWNHPALVEVGGHGAEIVKGTFTKTSLFKIGFRRRIVKYLRKRSEIRAGLKSIGIKFGDKRKMQWHHLAYKSAIQNGRSLDRTMLSLRPLMNKRLCSLGLHAPLGEPNTILQDMLIVIDPSLAEIPFDKVEKNIPKAKISTIISDLEKNGGFKKIEPYKLRGGILDMKNGVLESFKTFGDDFEYDSGDIKLCLKNKMEQIWNHLDSKNLKKQYSDAHKLALERLTDENSYPPAAGTPAAKIFSLTLPDKA
tara:strand:+ start:209 stop:2023 length:1815 start_codon:yes stop_codon:yes gene_type:complete